MPCKSMQISTIDRMCCLGGVRWRRYGRHARLPSPPQMGGGRRACEAAFTWREYRALPGVSTGLYLTHGCSAGREVGWRFVG